jgi:hypothetical protein
MAYTHIAQCDIEYEELELGELAEDDGDLVVRELDIDEDGLVGLMDHLSTFDNM